MAEAAQVDSCTKQELREELTRQLGDLSSTFLREFRELRVHMQDLTGSEPPLFKLLERLFCVIFTLEILLRIWFFRFAFFATEHWTWNIFDLVVVVMQIIDVLLEETVEIVARSTESHTEEDLRANVSIVRVLRILRLVRILRVLRTLRSVSELRTIIVSIFGTVRTLMWTMLLLFLVIFIIAVTITQVVTYHLLGEVNPKVRGDLQKYYGSLGSSILVLFQAITNGVDWEDVLAPLMDHISPWLALPVCIYIGFGVFALMNIVTGVFVESALESAQREKERFLLHTVKALFQSTDEDNSGDISWLEFEAKLDHPAMHLYFKTIDLDIQEAEGLFRLIDINDSGSIDPEEFVNGCIRLQGPAKAIDLATLMHEFKKSQRLQASRFRHLAAVMTSQPAGLAPVRLQTATVQV